MANKKIKELEVAITANDTDDLIIEDVNKTKRISFLSLCGLILKRMGVETGANKYVHPSGDGYGHVPANGTGSNEKVLMSSSTPGRATWETLTKGHVGLSSANDTSDADKPVSRATSLALGNKVDKIAGKQLSTNDYTAADKTKLDSVAVGATRVIVDPVMIEGSKNPVQSDVISDILDAFGSDNMDLRKTIASHVQHKANPHTVTKAQVGLSNVDNTSDLSKPISTLAQTALNAKASISAATSLNFVDATASSWNVSVQQVIGDRVFVEINFKTGRVLNANQQVKFKGYWTPVTDYDLRFLTYDTGIQFMTSISTYTDSFYLMPTTSVGANMWIRGQLTYRTTGVMHA